MTDFIEPKALAAAAVLVALWLAEAAAPMFTGRRRRLRHYGVNLFLGLANGLIVSLLLVGTLLVATEWAAARGFGLLHWLALPPWATWLLAIVLIDAWQYLWHVLAHKSAFLWRFHKVHHSDAEMDASTGVRFHTGEILLSTLARLAVLPLLGVTIPQLVVYEAILLPVILFHHSNVAIPARLDRVLRLVIVTPYMHWVHHSRYQPETDSNFSSIFSFWDRLFRTFRLREDPHGIQLGLEQYGERETHNLLALWRLPFKKD